MLEVSCWVLNVHQALMRKATAVVHERTFDLGDRLIQFSGAVIDIIEFLPDRRSTGHIAGQLLRAGTSAAPNHAEAQSAESCRDFIHKMKLALKELRETQVWLKLILPKRYIEQTGELQRMIKECDELTAIFVASIATAGRRLGADQRRTMYRAG
jgi:four helix bundle protein